MIGGWWRQPRPRFSASRRSFLRRGLRAGAWGAGLVATSFVRVPPAAAACGGGAEDMGPLQDPDANGLRLPPGFDSRVVAVAEEAPLSGGSHSWHRYPDGGATFSAPDGGWVYVSNSEASSGGVGALRFDSDGLLVDAYSILTGTVRNCAGGPTPWGTWLSCEEMTDGETFECDPLAPGSQGTARPTLGIFNHEAAAVDPVGERVYLTEDRTDGLLYRFTPASYPDLSAGPPLEAAEILDPQGEGAIAPGQVRPLAWHPLANSAPTGGGVASSSHLPVGERSTRFQVPAATTFNGGEGCWYEGGIITFSTKGDNRIWALDPASDTIEIVYDKATSSHPVLSGVDNVYAACTGDVYVAEDGGDMELVAITPRLDVKPIVQVVDQSFSEITGPALSPDGTRLYFSSQRGPGPSGNLGVTYEVSGPFAPAIPVPDLGTAASALLTGLLGSIAALGHRRTARRRDRVERC